MGKLKNENYFVVQGWMINELKLSGIDLLIFAIIWGFTQNVNSFTGSISYLEECTGASRATVMRSLKRLCEKKILSKCTVSTDSGLCCIYKTEKGYQNDTTPSIKMTYPQYQNDTTPSIKMIPNNTINTSNNNSSNNTNPSSSEDVEKKKKLDNNAIKLSNLLYQECKKQNDKFKVTDKQLYQWASDIEKLNRIDGYDYSLIKDVLLWCKNDDFWSINIQSGSKFRKQFNVLYLKAKKDKTPYFTNPNENSNILGNRATSHDEEMIDKLLDKEVGGFLPKYED